jgi:calnexin
MQNDILFDNIYIGHSVEDAEKLREETFVPKLAAEKAEEEALAPKPVETPKGLLDIEFKDDPVLFISDRLKYFVNLAKSDPVTAVKELPQIAAGLGAVVVAVLAIIASALTGGKAPSKEQVKAKAKQAKDAAVDAKDKAAEAVTTGADKAQAELNKRTTRSTSS